MMKQRPKGAQMRKDFLSKIHVQRRGEINSPNHWHWASDAVFRVSRGIEVQEQWPPLSNIESNDVGSGTKDCDKPASKDDESSTSKDRITLASEGLDSSESAGNVNLTSADHVSSTSEDCVGLASEDRVSSKRKGQDTSQRGVMNDVEAKCNEWARVASKPHKHVTQPT